MVVNLEPGTIAVMADGKRCLVVTSADERGCFKAVESDGKITSFHESSVAEVSKDDGTAL